MRKELFCGELRLRYQDIRKATLAIIQLEDERITTNIVFDQLRTGRCGIIGFFATLVVKPLSNFL